MAQTGWILLWELEICKHKFHGSVKLCIYLSFWTGERFSPGVGQVGATDEIKREIIHQLSIKPMAHSELVKSLPEDVSVCSF